MRDQENMKSPQQPGRIHIDHPPGDCQTEAGPGGKQYGSSGSKVRGFELNAQVPPWLFGRDVVFCPPQECKGELEYYAAKIVKINKRSAEFGGIETVDLVTFGPNSIYFQHNVPQSHELKAGHWTLFR